MFNMEVLHGDYKRRRVIGSYTDRSRARAMGWIQKVTRAEGLRCLGRGKTGKTRTWHPWQPFKPSLWIGPLIFHIAGHTV